MSSRWFVSPPRSWKTWPGSIEVSWSCLSIGVFRGVNNDCSRCFYICGAGIFARSALYLRSVLFDCSPFEAPAQAAQLMRANRSAAPSFKSTFSCCRAVKLLLLAIVVSNARCSVLGVVERRYL